MRTITRTRPLQHRRNPRIATHLDIRQRVERPRRPHRNRTREADTHPRAAAGKAPPTPGPRDATSITSSVNARCSRPGLRAFAHPPFTAGDQPTLRVEAFSHRNAYTASRPTNNDRNNATVSARVIGPGPTRGGLRLFDAPSPFVASANSVGSHAAAGALSASRSKPNNDRSRSFSAFNASTATNAAASRASPTPSSADRINQGYAASSSHPRDPTIRKKRFQRR